jgi:hypothetical protein
MKIYLFPYVTLPVFHFEAKFSGIDSVFTLIFFMRLLSNHLCSLAFFLSCLLLGNSWSGKILPGFIQCGSANSDLNNVVQP